MLGEVSMLRQDNSRFRRTWCVPSGPDLPNLQSQSQGEPRIRHIRFGLHDAYAFHGFCMVLLLQVVHAIFVYLRIARFDVVIAIVRFILRSNFCVCRFFVETWSVFFPMQNWLYEILLFVIFISKRVRIKWSVFQLKFRRGKFAYAFLIRQYCTLAERQKIK